MDRPSGSKPSLSQQLLRSFRPRASTAAAPFTSSTTASPISTPIDHAFSSEGNGSNNISAFNAVNILDRNVNLLEKSESFSISDFQAYINELKKPIQAEAGSELEEKIISDRISKLHVLVFATNKQLEEENSQDEEKITERDTQQITSTTSSSGPPQAEVFKMCLQLLVQARDGVLPLSLRLGVCELATASVKLSDVRAAKGTKAVRETRSGAPGSQSSKVVDADHPLANIDRAALYDLVCHLSDGFEGDLPTKDNWHQSQLPALPVQLKALEVLSNHGRDVVSFPGILDFLSQALEIIWKELQILRRLPTRNDQHANSNNSDEENMIKLAEQLSAREWSMIATLQLITSIIKCAFAMLDLARVETVLSRIASMFLGSWHAMAAIAPSPKVRALNRNRSKSREKKPLTEGYDYYGIETLTPANQSRSSSPTPKTSNTPKFGPRMETSSVAPIALATLAPASSGNSMSTSGTNNLKVLEQPILQTSDVRAVLILIDTIIRFGSIPSASVDSVTKVLCCILAYPDPLLHGQGMAKGTDWTPLLMPVLENLLKGHCANASLRSVRNLLVNVNKLPNNHVLILVGAIDFLRNALFLVAKHGGSSQIGMNGSNAKESALAPSLSLPLLLPALEGALQRHMDVLDLHVLRLVADMLPLKSDGTERQETLLTGSVTQDDWDSLLDLTVVARRHIEGWKVTGDAGGLFPNGLFHKGVLNENSPFQASVVVVAMMDLISRLKLGSPSGMDDNTPTTFDKPSSLPWTPKLAALLLSLAPLLSSELMESLIQFNKANDLCLPCTPEWIKNIRALLTAFFHRQDFAIKEQETSTFVSARRSLVALVFEHVYGTVQDFPEHRCALMLEVILPLAQSALGSEPDEVIDSTIRSVLVGGAAMAISQSHGVAHSRPDEASQQDGKRQQDEFYDKDQRIFEQVCDLFCKSARITSTSAATLGQSTTHVEKDASHSHVSFIDPPGAHDHKPMTRTHSRTHSRSNSVTRDSPTVVPATTMSNKLLTKQSQSALNLIAIFNSLAFSSPWALLSLSLAKDQERSHNDWEKGAREACIAIFRRLLGLIQPESQDLPSVSVRLVILQWLVRLRTDRQHRVYLAENMDELIAPSATSIQRGVVIAPDLNTVEVPNLTTEKGKPSKKAAEVVGPSALLREGGRDTERSTSRAERSISRVRDSSKDRGRIEQSPKVGTDRDRSSSRTRTPAAPNTHGHAMTVKKSIVAIDTQPLWRLPDVIHFEIPGSKLRSDIVFTYTHPEWSNHSTADHRHGGQSKGGERPTSLPISEYMAICINIITKEKDWDLVSYLLCHMPHQLANKHLFCGPKAQRQIVILREMLTGKITEQKLLSQISLPDKVKNSDVSAIAYGTLTALISYRALFTRSQQDELVEAFMAGLNNSSNTAQPCVRALSIACYELQKSINRHLPKMLVRLTMVMSSRAMSVHILELIASIAHLPNLYANFTDTDFRRIFGIALQYIQYHNQDQQIREEDQRTFNATTFTLAQYVLMLAYYNICLWFMSLRFNDRLKHVESIRRGLLAANEGKEKVSDQTEVCFDFLARFTYSDVSPRPKQSYLNKIIKASNTNAISKTYLFNKCLVTVTSFTKFGGAELLIRRSSGTLALTCRIENAHASQLPDEDGERVEASASIMMNRHGGIPSIKDWTRNQLDIADQLRTHGARGPARLGLVKRERSLSMSESLETNGDGFRLEHRKVDAYSVSNGNAIDLKQGLEEDKESVIQVESDRLEESMKQILGEEVVREDDNVNDVDESTEDKTNARRLNHSSSREFQMDPGFLALQLSSFPDMTGNAPILLPNEPSTQRLVRSIDLTPVVDFHKIGVLYVGTGQTTEKEILGNRSGSRSYTNFLTGLGELVTLKGQQDVYTGGLDIRNDEHGKFTYVWGDDISQIVYHVTTLMPNNIAEDANHSGKKALIGNDWVRIVWNESGREYNFDTIKTQFNFINIVISPNSRGGGEVGSVNASDTIYYRVSLQSIEGLPTFSPVGDGQLISAANLANFVRILALNSNLVSQIFVATNGRETGTPYSYTSNWVSRLQHIERARAKVETTNSKELLASTESAGGISTEVENRDQTAYDISRF